MFYCNRHCPDCPYCAPLHPTGPYNAPMARLARPVPLAPLVHRDLQAGSDSLAPQAQPGRLELPDLPAPLVPQGQQV